LLAPADAGAPDDGALDGAVVAGAGVAGAALGAVVAVLLHAATSTIAAAITVNSRHLVLSINPVPPLSLERTPHRGRSSRPAEAGLHVGSGGTQLLVLQLQLGLVNLELVIQALDIGRAGPG